MGSKWFLSPSTRSDLRTSIKSELRSACGGPWIICKNNCVTRIFQYYGEEIIIGWRLKPEDEEQHFPASEGRAVLEPGWKWIVNPLSTPFLALFLPPFKPFLPVFYPFFTWLEEPVVVENVGRGIVEHVEEGPRPNLKNAIMKKILMILMMRPHSKIKLFREGVNVQRVI